MEPTIVYPARMIRTMDPSRPTAEAIAVRGERIRALGTVAELMAYPDAVRDDRYADADLVPGFVESHSHAGSGNMWNDTYVGLVDRTDPNGKRWLRTSDTSFFASITSSSGSPPVLRFSTRSMKLSRYRARGWTATSCVTLYSSGFA